MNADRLGAYCACKVVHATQSVSAQLRQLVMEAIARLEGLGLLVREAGLLMAVETKGA